MLNRKALVLNSLIVFSLGLLGLSYADDAAVLPRGVFRTTLDNFSYLPYNKRYKPNGDVEDTAHDFNVALNSNVFPSLAPLDPLVPGLPSLGDSQVAFKYYVNITNLGLQYGLTDKVTIGMNFPYWRVKNKVKTNVDSGAGSSANVGKNAAANSLLPLTTAGTVPLTTDDVQKLIGEGLDINGDGKVDVAGLGFQRLQTWSDNDIGDIEAGFRYQYFRNADLRLAFGSGGRFPTGRVDDINNLADIEFGRGAYTVLFQLNNDFVVSNLWKAKSAAEGDQALQEPGTLILNATSRYDLYLPDRERKRVSSNASNPLTSNKERVRRNLGDRVELETAAYYTLLTGLRLSYLYKYGFKQKDAVSGRKGFAYTSLEEETKAIEQLYIIGLSYSTVPLYMEKKFPLPMAASISYRNRFKGTDNYGRTQYFGVGLQVFF